MESTKGTVTGPVVTPVDFRAKYHQKYTSSRYSSYYHRSCTIRSALSSGIREQAWCARTLTRRVPRDVGEVLRTEDREEARDSILAQDQEYDIDLEQDLGRTCRTRAAMHQRVGPRLAVRLGFLHDEGPLHKPLVYSYQLIKAPATRPNPTPKQTVYTRALAVNWPLERVSTVFPMTRSAGSARVARKPRVQTVTKVMTIPI